MRFFYASLIIFLSLSCEQSKTPPTLPEPADSNYFIRGLDLSFTTEMLQHGVRYKDGSVVKNLLELAREKGMDYFSTTLLVSPYQDHGLLKQIGNEVSLQTGVAFYYEDYRAGFYNARKIAKEKGIYRQKYCGCLYSESEQCKKPS
ncbi:MAG: hypothetical protein BWY70_02040 [Bacteroidetes bacterium ADurb.Bin408]|nr:MAG: hypothetical protein BWY70_02040 [Bacteroidetes bacterium ADurb.Bin408]